MSSTMKSPAVDGAVGPDQAGRVPHGRGQDPGEATREGAAARLSRELLSDEALDELIARAGDGQVRLTGPGGFLPELVARVLERGMGAELCDHLGYERGDPAGRGSPNSRNGSTPKTLRTRSGTCRSRPRGTGPAPSSRGWRPREPAGWTAWTR